MIVLKLIWFVAKWWFLIGATLSVTYVCLMFLRQKLREHETWFFTVMLLFVWPPIMWMWTTSAWQNRGDIKGQVFSGDATRQLGQNKKLACIAGAAILAGLWMLINFASGNREPDYAGRAFCPFCNKDFAYSLLESQSADRSLWNCPKCGKPYQRISQQDKTGEMK
jgi:hypothetical protein